MLVLVRLFTFFSSTFSDTYLGEHSTAAPNTHGGNQTGNKGRRDEEEEVPDSDPPAKEHSQLQLHTTATQQKSEDFRKCYIKYPIIGLISFQLSTKILRM